MRSQKNQKGKIEHNVEFSSVIFTENKNEQTIVLNSKFRRVKSSMGERTFRVSSPVFVLANLN